MKIRTTSGEIVYLHKKEIIWNALDYMRANGCADDEIFLALNPRRESVRVRRDELTKLIDLISPQYS